MPRKKPSALDALARHNDERRALDDRGAELRRAAALELGLAVLDAGGDVLSLSEVRSAISAAVQSHGRDGQAPDQGHAERIGEAPAEEQAHG